MMKNTILIAEDDFKIRQMVTLFLKGNNFEVIQAADGEEALDLFYEHNKDIDLRFHIFCDEIDNETKEKLNELAQQYTSTIRIYIVNSENFKSLPSTKNWSYATYFRFIVADYFYQKIEKVIYIDADIICNNSIEELIDVDLTHHIAAAVAEGKQEWWQKRATKLEVDAIAAGYFNAGFLLINLAKWQRHEVTKKAITMLHDDEVKKKISFLDQDVLNILLAGKVIYLNIKYNTQFSINYELKADYKKNYDNPINENTVFIHYIGPTKPWHNWADYPSAQYFLHAKEHSPWKNSPLLIVTTSNQLRYCAKHQLNKKLYLDWMISYIKYFYKKTMK